MTIDDYSYRANPGNPSQHSAAAKARHGDSADLKAVGRLEDSYNNGDMSANVASQLLELAHQIEHNPPAATG